MFCGICDERWYNNQDVDGCWMLFLSRLGGSFKDVFIFTFHPDFLGEMIQLDKHIFQTGWFNHQRVGIVPSLCTFDG